MHAHDGEVGSAGGEFEVEGRFFWSGGRFIQTKNGLGIAKNIGWPDEAAQGAVDRQDGQLGGNRGRCSFGIGQLMAVPNRAEGDEVSDQLANRRLDLLGRRTD
jgi:hypothetical protein